MHLTHATYLPNLLLKMVTATESRHVTVRDTTHISNSQILHVHVSFA